MKAFVLAALLCFAATARADDGWVGYSGSPKLMGSHPTVRMLSESVHITVHRDVADVTCDFQFRNSGHALAVRMGFPDYGSGGPELMKDLRSTFAFFRSYIDGKRAKTKLEAAPLRNSEFDEPVYDEAYQVKAVAFSPGQMRRVRDVYRVPLGSDALWGHIDNKGTPANNLVAYIFSTGASWKGTIGRAELSITFAPDARLPKGKLDKQSPPAYDDSTESGSKKLWNWWAAHRRNLAGASKFTLRGRTLKLVRTNWKPSETDDVSIAFGYFLRN